MRVFLDTNVLVTAFTARGLCADLFRYLLAEHEVMTGEVNLIELRRVLRESFRAEADQVTSVESLLRDQTIVPKPGVRPAIGLGDPDDSWVLASAIAGRADMLVIGDQDLLVVADRVELPILSPRGAWSQLRGKRDPGS